jgi:hypothetical protein
MFKIEKTRPTEPNIWQHSEQEQAIEHAKAVLHAPGDVVTVTDSRTGETLWMGIFGRDGRCHEWSRDKPSQIRVDAALAPAA